MPLQSFQVCCSFTRTLCFHKCHRTLRSSELDLKSDPALLDLTLGTEVLAWVGLVSLAGVDLRVGLGVDVALVCVEPLHEHTDARMACTPGLELIG